MANGGLHYEDKVTIMKTVHKYYGSKLVHNLVLCSALAVCVYTPVTIAAYFLEPIEDESALRQYESVGAHFEHNAYQRLDSEYRGEWLSGDFDGDGLDDVTQVFSWPDGTARALSYIFMNDGTSLDHRFGFVQLQGTTPGEWHTGDFNGDGKSDLVHIYRAPPIVDPERKALALVYTYNGVSFVAQYITSLGAGYWDSQRWEVGDFNGDGMDDIVLVYGHSTYGATAWVYSSNGAGFDRTHMQRLDANYGDSQQWETGDFNGDELDDLVLVYGHDTYGATAWIYSSNGSGFTRTSTQRLDAGFSEYQRWEVGNFDGDRFDDIVLVYGHSTEGATAWIYSSNGVGFARTSTQRLGATFWNSQAWLTADFNGDGLDGLALFYGDGKPAPEPILDTQDTSNSASEPQQLEHVEDVIVESNDDTQDTISDSDGDGVPDADDNCTLHHNPNQLDTDGDGYGNLCDGDLNNDGSTNFPDRKLYKRAHNSAVGDANYNVDADFNGDGAINTLDKDIYDSLHGQVPGPSCCGVF